MLDTGGTERERGQTLHCSHTGSVQARLKRSTVKELLTMKRQQKWVYSPDHEPGFKHARFQPPANALGPTGGILHFSPPPLLHHMQHPSCSSSTSSQMEITLFHWQIQQAERRVEHLSAEQLNAQDEDGDTFLHIAVAQGKRALAYVLAREMSQCGSVDMKEHNRQTALQIAVASDQHLIAGDLLRHGAWLGARDLWGRSPLHVCAEKGHMSTLQSIWNFLVETGQHVDVDMLNYEGLTPLHSAVLSHNAVLKDMKTLKNPCLFMTKELEKKKQQYAECVRTLLLMGASSMAQDMKSGRTCLHMASEEANMELLKVFLNIPMSLSIVNVKTFSGNTALHIVCSLNNPSLEAVKLLMRKGADPGARNCENEIPSQLAPEGLEGEKVRQSLKGQHMLA
ncbi:unnamed protein product [Ophioblennius macclurei]